jgi:hypothetical protein
MAEPHNTAEQYEETTDPRNPPNSVLRPDVRRATTWSFLLMLIVSTVIAGLLWVFWLGQPGHVRDADDTGNGTNVTGTSGERTPGGINPDPSYNRTEDELKFRGVTGMAGEKNGARLQETQSDGKN